MWGGDAMSSFMVLHGCSKQLNIIGSACLRGLSKASSQSGEQLWGETDSDWYQLQWRTCIGDLMECNRNKRAFVWRRAGQKILDSIVMLWHLPACLPACPLMPKNTCVWNKDRHVLDVCRHRPNMRGVMDALATNLTLRRCQPGVSNLTQLPCYLLHSCIDLASCPSCSEISSFQTWLPWSTCSHGPPVWDT